MKETEAQGLLGEDLGDAGTSAGSATNQWAAMLVFLFAGILPIVDILAIASF